MNILFLGGPAHGTVTEVSYGFPRYFFPVSLAPKLYESSEGVFEPLKKHVYEMDWRSGVGYYRGVE